MPATARSAIAAIVVGCGLVLAPSALAASAYSVTTISGPGATIEQGEALNASGDVVGLAKFGMSVPTCGFLWHSGTLTPLPAAFANGSHGTSEPGCNGSGTGGDTAWDINDSALIVGTADYEPPPTVTTRVTEAATWQGTTGPTRLGSGCGQALAVNAAGTTAGACQAGAWLGSPSNVIAPGSPNPGGKGDAQAIAINGGGQAVVYYDGAGSPGTRPTAALYPGLAPLPVVPVVVLNGRSVRGAPGTLNDSGVVVGGVVGGSGASVTIGAAFSQNAGAATKLPAAGGLADATASGVNNQGDVVGSSFNRTGTSIATIWPRAAPPAAGPPSDGVDLNTLIPANAGITLQAAVAINSRGQILAAGTAGGAVSWVVLNPSSLSIKGRVVRGEDGTHPAAPEQGAEGVLVQVKGTTKLGASFTSSASTDANGDYEITAPPGSYSVTLPETACVRGLPGCVHSADVEVSDADVTVDGVALVSALQVTVKTKPGSPVDVKQELKGPVPEKLEAIVTVKDVGKAPVNQVRLDSTLLITFAHGAPKVAEIPIDQKGKPKPQLLGTLKPDQSKRGTYKLMVRGDGSYDLSALAEGTQPGVGKVGAVGHAIFESRSPLLVFTAKLGREVHGPDARSLIQAGSTFTVRIHLENRSYQKTVVVAPMHALLTGNAQDGHVQLDGEPIEALDSVAACTPGDAVVLEPRQSKDLEAIIRTSSSNPTLVGPDGQAEQPPSGGTRATISFKDPKGWVLKDDGTVGRRLDSKDVLVDPEAKEFTAHIDDRGLPAQAPKSYYDAAVYFSHGLVIGAGEALVGVIHGLLIDVPKLIGHGILGFPHAFLTYAQLEAELWNDVRGNPALQAAYLSVVANTTLLAFRHAPQLEEEAQKLIASTNAEVLSHYTKLWRDWYAGDWTGAAQAFGEESGDAVANIGLLASGCVLTRLPAVVEGFNVARAAAYARVTEELSRFPAAIRALDALDALKNIVPGFEFTNNQLRQFSGLLVDESDFLRNYAREHRYLIVARPRAAESVRLLKEGLSVLKSELIKTKTVTQMDIDFLGYDRSELAQVALRKPPSETEVAKALRAQHFSESDGTWAEAMARRATRLEEDEKYTKGLEDLARKGEVTLRFNLEGNAMDPTALDNVPTTYRFRLASGPNGDRIPQFFVGGRWRSVTGDVDFLQITHADGSPLTLAQRAQVYRDFSRSPVGMLHGESATWQNNQAFDFAAKINEFVRAGTVVQFGPDGVARGVQFVGGLSKFKDELHYYVHWLGGYVIP